MKSATKTFLVNIVRARAKQSLQLTFVAEKEQIQFDGDA